MNQALIPGFSFTFGRINMTDSFGCRATMNYIDEGSRGSENRESILMLHGNPTWSYFYRGLIGKVRASSRVIAPDHIGCGFSDKPPDYCYTLEQHIKNIETLVDRLGLDRITLVVHDWGGPIGFGFATRHPEKVARIVVLNTVAFFLPTLPWFLRLCQAPVAGELCVQTLNLFLKITLHIGAVKKLDPAVKAGYLAPYSRARERLAILRFIRDIPVKTSHPSYETLRQIEEQLTVLRAHPLDICWGMRDPVFTPEVLDMWRLRFSPAELRTFENAGHLLLEDALDEIAAVVKRTTGPKSNDDKREAQALKRHDRSSSTV